MTAVTDPFDDLALAPLGPADAGRGAALSAEIGWNQTADDWRYMLENGPGWGRSDAHGRLVGSAMALLVLELLAMVAAGAPGNRGLDVLPGSGGAVAVAGAEYAVGIVLFVSLIEKVRYIRARLR